MEQLETKMSPQYKRRILTLTTTSFVLSIALFCTAQYKIHDPALFILRVSTTIADLSLYLWAGSLLRSGRALNWRLGLVVYLIPWLSIVWLTLIPHEKSVEGDQR